MKRNTKIGDTPMRANSALVIEPAESWKRLQAANPEFFYENLDEYLQEQYRAIINQLMLHERQEFLRCHPYQRREERLDQANGFYKRHLTTRCGCLELGVCRARAAVCFARRSSAAINGAIRR